MYICMYVLYIYIYIYVCMYIRGFPGGTSGKELSCQCRRQKRDAGSIPGSGRSLHTLGMLSHTLATHSSILAWRIPLTEELSRRQSTG